MRLLYLIGIRAYWATAVLFSFFNRKAALFVRGRRGLLRRIESLGISNDPVIWFHCSSVGEFEQARPLIEALKPRFPEYKILLTFFSPSGYELRKNYAFADYVFYLPMDTPLNVYRFINAVRPRMAVFVKYEFWYYYLRFLKRSGIPTYLVSALFQKKQPFFRWYGRFFRSMLDTYAHLFVQDDLSESLLSGIGIKNVTVTGDTRFDRVYEIVGKAKDISEVSAFSSGRITLVAGSSWQPDEEIIIPSCRDAALPGLKVVIAPHEVESRNIERLENLIVENNLSSVKYSDARQEPHLQNKDLFILDTIGLLSSAYRYASIAYVGGGFGSGIHNILEPAVYGIPVIIGPNFSRFREAQELVELGGVKAVNSPEEFSEILELLIRDESLRKKMGGICRDYVKNNLGAAESIIAFWEQSVLKK